LQAVTSQWKNFKSGQLGLTFAVMGSFYRSMRSKKFWLIALVLVSIWGHHVWLRVGQPVMNDAIRAQYSRTSVQLSAGKTAYEYYPGEGPVVILVHGFSLSSVVWDATFRALSENGYSVLRYDLFGRGFSDRPGVRYDANLFDTQLKELTDKIVPQRKLILCGLSMGGAISVRFADRYPDRVSKLVLIDPAGMPMPLPITGWIAKIPGIGDYFGRLFARRAILRGIAQSFASPPPKALVDNAILQTEFTGYADAIVSTVRYMDLVGLESIFKSVGARNLETLLLWGEEDHVIPYANAALVQRSIPSAQLVSVRGAGHVPNVDHPLETNAAILEFLNR
jgi:pimeloyl-ACP methyl ester carboxylesterase